MHYSITFNPSTFVQIEVPTLPSYLSMSLFCPLIHSSELGIMIFKRIDVLHWEAQ